MKKSIIELFSSLMSLEENFSILYKNIAAIEGQVDQKLKNAATVLSRAEKQHAQFYKKLIDDMNTSEKAILIDASLIEQARNYLRTFKQSMGHSTMTSVKELLTLAIEFEDNNALILKQILELLAEEEEENKRLVEVFELLILEEYKHSKNLKQFLK